MSKIILQALRDNLELQEREQVNAFIENDVWSTYEVAPSEETKGLVAYTNPDRNTRVKTSIIKLLQKRAPELLENINAAVFAQQFQTYIANAQPDCDAPRFEGKIVTGPEISEMYVWLDRKYGLWSCMVKEERQTALYAENPEIFDLAATWGPGGAARTLIWKIDGERYHDRVYGKGKPVESLRALIGYLRHIEDADVGSVEVKVPSNGYWPYIDTLYNVELHDDTAYLSESSSWHSVKARSTNGCLEGMQVCDHCGYQGDEDYMTCIDEIWVCEDCRSEHYIVCDCCENFAEADEASIVVIHRPHYRSYEETWCESCAAEHAFWCAHCEAWYDERRGRESLVEVRNGQQFETWCSDCASESAARCERCEDYCIAEHGSKIVVNDDEDSEFWCECCAERHAIRCPGCGDDVDRDRFDTMLQRCSLCVEASEKEEHEQIEVETIIRNWEEPELIAS